MKRALVAIFFLLLQALPLWCGCGAAVMTPPPSAPLSPDCHRCPSGSHADRCCRPDEDQSQKQAPVRPGRPCPDACCENRGGDFRCPARAPLLPISCAPTLPLNIHPVPLCDRGPVELAPRLVPVRISAEIRGPWVQDSAATVRARMCCWTI